MTRLHWPRGRKLTTQRLFKLPGFGIAACGALEGGLTGDSLDNAEAKEHAAASPECLAGNFTIYFTLIHL